MERWKRENQEAEPRAAGLVANSNVNQESEPSTEHATSSLERNRPSNIDVGHSGSSSVAIHIVRASGARRYFDQCVPLYKAAYKGDWEAATSLVREDDSLVRAHITTGGETALHIAAGEGHVSFVENLLGMMNASDLEILNKKQSTELCFAAAAGNTDIVQLKLNKNRNLPKVRGDNGFTPLYMAVLQGHKKLAEDLFTLSDFDSWEERDQIELLTTSIHSGLYDLAVRMVKENENLAVAEDYNGQKPLEVLASKPSAFCGTNRQGFRGNVLSTILSYTKLNACDIPEPCDAYALFNCLWTIVISHEDVEAPASLPNDISHEDVEVPTSLPNEISHDIVVEVPGSSLSKLLFLAAESGNYDFLIELIERDPNLIYEMNHLKHSIFHIAVLHRHVKVFHLVYEHRVAKDFILSAIDTDNNNILHLAARLSPQVKLDLIPGATLQMQQDVLWYKVVEKMVPLSYRNTINSDRQTPHNLFLAEHKNLMKGAEKQMKQIAKSCMVVSILIATFVFSTTFTVPGGYNNEGAPILQDKKFFIAFPISEAVAILASLSSILMLLSVLTSRYSANDFLRWLPFWLVVGVATLFVSIVAMMVALCTNLLFYKHGVAMVIVVLVFLAILLIVFFILKYNLFITLLRYTYGFRSLLRSSNRLRL